METLHIDITNRRGQVKRVVRFDVEDRGAVDQINPSQMQRVTLVFGDIKAALCQRNAAQSGDYRQQKDEKKCGFRSAHAPALSIFCHTSLS